MINSTKHQQAYPIQVTKAERAVRASILMVNFNGRDDLEISLASITGSLPPDCEIILVDNASTDGSAAFVEEAFPDVHVIRNDHNLGFAGGCNVAAEAARGDILVFLNPDTAVTPGWLEPLVSALDTQPDIGLVTPKILLMEQPDRVNTCGNSVHLTGITLCRGLGLPADQFTGTEDVSAISGAAFAARKSEFERLGGFDPAFFMYMEDTDLSLRYQLAGYRCRLVAESVIYHQYRLRVGPSKIFYQEYNRYTMLLKNLRWRTLLALLPAFLLAEGITWGFVCLRDRRNFPNKLRAYAAVIKNRAAILAARQGVQAARKIPDRQLLQQFSGDLDFAQTGGGIVTTIAAQVFNPLFSMYRRFVLYLIRW